MYVHNKQEHSVIFLEITNISTSVIFTPFQIVFSYMEMMFYDCRNKTANSCLSNANFIAFYPKCTVLNDPFSFLLFQQNYSLIGKDYQNIVHKLYLPLFLFITSQALHWRCGLQWQLSRLGKTPPKNLISHILQQLFIA